MRDSAALACALAFGLCLAACGAEEETGQVAASSSTEPDVEETGVEETGVEETGVEETGVEETGVEGPDVGEQLQVSGQLDRRVLHLIARRNRNDAQMCFHRGIGRNPNLRGRVFVRFTISGTGRVTQSAVARSSIRDNSVNSCLAAMVRRWRFPRPAGGGSTNVTYRFSYP